MIAVATKYAQSASLMRSLQAFGNPRFASSGKRTTVRNPKKMRERRAQQRAAYDTQQSQLQTVSHNPISSPLPIANRHQPETFGESMAQYFKLGIGVSVGFMVVGVIGKLIGLDAPDRGDATTGSVTQDDSAGEARRTD